MLNVESKPPHVVAIVQLPPPVTGLSAMNSHMVDALRDAGLLAEVANIAPALNSRRASKVLGRLIRVLRAGGVLFTAKRRGATTLYMPSDGGIGIILNIGLGIVARLLGYRLWIHHHSFAYLNRRSRLMALLLLIAPSDTGHLILCEGMLTRLRDRYPRAWMTRRHHAHVLSNAFVIEVQEASESHGQPLVIGHLANLTQEKGAVRFVEIFKSLRTEGVQITARIAGPIGDAETNSAIESAAATYPTSFYWSGPLYGEAKAEFYRSLDVFVFPTRYADEAQPLVLLEALAGGCAILSTDLGCIGCDHGEAPGLIASDDAFDEAAKLWLKRHTDVHTRVALPQSARSVVGRAKSAAEAQLASFLAQL